MATGDACGCFFCFPSSFSSFSVEWHGPWFVRQLVWRWPLFPKDISPLWATRRWLDFACGRYFVSTFAASKVVKMPLDVDPGTSMEFSGWHQRGHGLLLLLRRCATFFFEAVGYEQNMNGQRWRWKKSKSHFPSTSFRELAFTSNISSFFQRKWPLHRANIEGLWDPFVCHNIKSQVEELSLRESFGWRIRWEDQPLTTGIMDKRSRSSGRGTLPFAGSPVVSRAVGFIFGCSSLLLSVLMGIFFFKDIQH